MSRDCVTSAANWVATVLRCAVETAAGRKLGSFRLGMKDLRDKALECQESGKGTVPGTANCIDHFSAFESGLVAPFLYAA
jgi:hypothetical protein